MCQKLQFVEKFLSVGLGQAHGSFHAVFGELSRILLEQFCAVRWAVNVTRGLARQQFIIDIRRLAKHGPKLNG